MLEVNAAKRLAAAVLHRAVLDASSRNLEKSAEALVWLASVEAEGYFTLTEWPQDRSLLKMDWLKLADRIRERPEKATDTQLAALQTTYDHLRLLA
jgi:hypothetical protein